MNNPPPAPRYSARAILPMIVPFPVVCFIGTLLTDIAYWRTAEMQWTNFSAWLLAAGMLVSVLAVIAALVDLARKDLVPWRKPEWAYLVPLLVAMAISFVNSLIHTRDAWTSVVPTGLWLSAACVVVLIIAGWLHWFSRPQAEVFRDGAVI
ncbi:MAG: DUF2231 domain-containing protein [Parvibaculaceae bacterium]